MDLVDEVKAFLEEHSIQTVKYAVTDIDGVLRSKILNKRKFLNGLTKGLGFCNVIFGWDMMDVCYDNTSYTGWHSAYPDELAFPDWSTKRRAAWENNQLTVLADFSHTDKFVPCPRTLLKKIRSQAREQGYTVVAAQEFEWFNFDKKRTQNIKKNTYKPFPITTGMYGYSSTRFSEKKDYVHQLLTDLEGYAIPVEGIHTETGPGVYEAAIEKDELLISADRAALFKSAVKEIAYHHGIMASFMAKWNLDLPGCSGHIHQSLWDLEGKQNLFYSADSEQTMSAEMRWYIAGQLHCLPYILPYFAPTINSYKRLIDGLWAPTTCSWGIENRTAALRAIVGGTSGQRLETRVPGSDCNPYLAMSAAVASGLYGIKHKLDLPAATAGNAYADKSLRRLPATLVEAVKSMKDSPIPAELFGQQFAEHFLQTREWEIQQFHQQVSDWEINRYFETV